MDIDDWWERVIEDQRAEAIIDCNKGEFNPPYPNSDDPTDEDENSAYVKAWKARRHELGDKFKWK